MVQCEKKDTDLLEKKKKKEIFLHVSALENSKLRVLKEDQVLKFDIKEDKDKLQAINLRENLDYRGVEQSGSSSGS